MGVRTSGELQRQIAVVGSLPLARAVRRTGSRTVVVPAVSGGPRTVRSRIWSDLSGSEERWEFFHTRKIAPNKSRIGPGPMFSHLADRGAHRAAQGDTGVSAATGVSSISPPTLSHDGREGKGW